MIKSLIIFLTVTMLAPVGRAFGEEPCDTALGSHLAELSQMTERDLHLQALVDDIAGHTPLSNSARSKLLEDLKGQDIARARGELVRKLVENPNVLAKFEAFIATTKRGPDFVADGLREGRVKAERAVELYKSFSEFAASASSLLGPKVALAVLIVNTALKGTRESAIYQKLKAGVTAIVKGHQMVTGQTPLERARNRASAAWGRVAERLQPHIPEHIQRLGQSAGEKAQGVFLIAMERGQVLLQQGQTLSAEVGDQIRDGVSNTIAETEITLALARYALRWKERGLPVTLGSFEASVYPHVDVVNAYHPTNLVGADPRPLTLKINQEVKGLQIVLLTGPAGGGKTVTIELLATLHALTRAGSMVPAESAVFARSEAFTSIASTTSSGSQMRELMTMVKHVKDSAGPVFLMVDEIASRLGPTDRPHRVAQLIDVLREQNVMLILSLSDPKLIEGLQLRASERVLVDWQQSQTHQLGVVHTPEGQAAVEDNPFMKF